MEKTSSIYFFSVNLIYLFGWIFFSFISHYKQSYFGIMILILLSLIHFCFLFFLRKIEKISLTKIIIYTIILKIPVLFSQPYFENDYYRYLWDGIVGSHIENPLIISPREVYIGKAVTNSINPKRQEYIDLRQEYLNFNEKENLLNKINYPESPSIYGPSAQMFLSLQTLPLKIYQNISRKNISVQFRIYWLRFSFLFLELISFIVFLKLLNYFQLPKSLFFIFVTNPLFLKEINNSIHIDILPMTLTLLAIYFICINKNLISIISLAFAAASKLYPIMLLPFLIKKISIKNYTILSSIFLSILSILYLPFILNGGKEIFAGTSYFSLLWSMNDFFSALIRGAIYSLFENHYDSHNIYPIGHISVSFAQYYGRLISLLCFLICLFYIWLKHLNKPNIINSCSHTLFFLYFFSTVQNPWYLVWGYPFFLLAQHWPYLLFTALAQFYLFNFYFEATSHIFQPFQWWVVLPWMIFIFVFFLRKKIKIMEIIQDKTYTTDKS